MQNFRLLISSDELDIEALKMATLSMKMHNLNLEDGKYIVGVPAR